MRFSREEYWSGLPCPLPGHLPNPGIELAFPALAGRVFAAEPLGKLPSWRLVPYFKYIKGPEMFMIKKMNFI